MPQMDIGRNWPSRWSVSTPGTDPPAGSEILITVPAGEVWQLCAVSVSLVTPAGLTAARRPHLVVDDGSNIIAQYPAPGTLNPGSTAQFSWCEGAGQSYAAGGAVFQSIGRTVLLPGFRIRTLTENLIAGDNYGAPTYQAEIWRPQ